MSANSARPTGVYRRAPAVHGARLRGSTGKSDRTETEPPRYRTSSGHRPPELLTFSPTPGPQRMLLGQREACRTLEPPVGAEHRARTGVDPDIPLWKEARQPPQREGRPPGGLTLVGQSAILHSKSSRKWAHNIGAFRSADVGHAIL